MLPIGHQVGLAAHQRVKGASRRAPVPGTRHNKLARRYPTTAGPRKTRPARLLQPHFRENTCPARHQTQILAIVSTQGELFRARTHIMPGRAKNIAHEARQHGDVETNNATARPQQGTTETTIASAPEKRRKNAYFSPAKAMAVSPSPPHRPAKAMAVSLQHRHQRVKATMVSDNRATWPTGPGRRARGP